MTMYSGDEFYGDEITSGYDPELERMVGFDQEYDDPEEEGEEPDTCLNTVDGHWYVVIYGRAPYQLHAKNCPTCEEGE